MGHHMRDSQTKERKAKETVHKKNNNTTAEGEHRPSDIDLEVSRRSGRVDVTGLKLLHRMLFIH